MYRIYRVYVPVYVEATVKVIAHNADEAKHIAKSAIIPTEYCNETVGVEINYNASKFDVEVESLMAEESHDNSYAEYVEDCPDIEDEEDEEDDE